MNYGALQTNFTTILNRRDCTTAQTQSFIQNSIMRVQRELRVPALEKSIVVTVGTPWLGLPIPTDLLELINIVDISTSGFAQQRLEKCDLTQAIELAAQTGGTPQVYCRRGAYWILGPAPGTGDQIQIDYYAEASQLVNSTDSNILTDVAWDLILNGALSFACDVFIDKRRDIFEQRYQQILEDMNNMASEDDASGGVSVQPAYRYPDNYGIEDYDILNWIP